VDPYNKQSNNGFGMTKIYPVIMCGGAGTRLWPMSKKSLPKQYQPIVTDKSMLRETINRFPKSGRLNVAPPSFVAAVSHKPHIQEACAAESVEPHLIVLEPCGRNTAPVAALVSLLIDSSDDALILLLPADHHIEDLEAFITAIEAGIPSAQGDSLVTFGIKPTGPETGYGYINSGEKRESDVFKVRRFVEKPDLETAKRYISSGDYFWNAGIFLFSAKTMIEAFEKFAPHILQACKLAIETGKHVNESVFLDPASFSECESDSIDYAIMEKADNVNIVAPVDMGWSDIGSWDALRQRALENNILAQGQGEIITIDCKETYVRSDGPTIAVIGVEDLIVVANSDEILIAKAGASQKVKKVVEHLEQDISKLR